MSSRLRFPSLGLFALLAAVVAFAQAPSPPTNLHVITSPGNAWVANGCGVHGDSDCLIRTSFSTADGFTQDYGQQITGGGTCAGFPADFTSLHLVQSFLGAGGNNVIASGWCDHVSAEANHSTGAGGRGFRHYRCDGDNCTGGGMTVNIPGSPGTAWMSYAVRWSSSLTLTSPGTYAKDMYFVSSKPYFVFGIQVGGPGFDVNGTYNACCTDATMPLRQYNGGQSNFDGNWHCWDIAFDAPNNRVQMWIDGAKIYDKNPATSIVGATMGGAQWGNNENNITGCAASGSNANCFTDYDDLRVSTSLTWGQRIGCTGNGS